ncbi:hypothetical protein [Acinetobacter bereziniae]|uniref:hypothetical protein n=1 Tax=Acinetobacter bereziniae TaxID=106648 RepID=UPI002091358F|nr:hypothetical protein [Acinetobacter bereziniae]
MENDLFYREDKIGFFIEINKSKVKGNLYRMEVWIESQSKTSFDTALSKKSQFVVKHHSSDMYFNLAK